MPEKGNSNNTTEKSPKGEKRAQSSAPTRFPRGGKEEFINDRKKSKVANSNEILFRNKEQEPLAKPVENRRVTKGMIINKIKENDVLNETQSSQKFVTPLSFTRLKIGTMLMGAIKEVDRNRLFIGLPFGLVGIVDKTETSDMFHSFSESEDSSATLDEIDLHLIYSVNQRVIVIVTELRTERKVKTISLSMRPSLLYPDIIATNPSKAMFVNALVQGEVIGKEDYGYTVSLGFNDTKAFYKCDTSEKQLVIGMQHLFLISKLDSRVVYLKDAKSGDAMKCISLTQKTPLSHLKAGYEVSCIVFDIFTNGLRVHVQGFEASIWYLSLRKRLIDLVDITVGSTLKARIIAIDYSTRQIFLSNVQTVQDPDYVPELPPVGQTYSDGEVIMIDDKRGMCLKNDVYIRVSQMSDKEVQNIQGLYKTGQNDIRYRVIDHDLIDNLAFGATASSVLNCSILTYDDATPGLLTQAIVTSVQQNCIRLTIGTQLRGIVYQDHMSELPSVSHPQKMFQVGKSIQVRILRVDVEKRLIFCTCKRSLLREDINILSDLDTVSTDLVYPGVCLSVNQYGVKVGFFNNITGFINASEMQRRGLHSDDFTVGRVVRVLVLSVDRERGHLSIIPADSDLDESQDIMGVVTSGVIVSENYKMSLYHEDVTGVVIHTENDVYGFLPAIHMGDHSTLLDALCSLYKRGVKVNKVGVLNPIVRQYYNDVPLWLLTTQPSLIRALEEKRIPKSLGQVQLNQQYYCYVSKIATFGAFVSFLGNLQALIPLRLMSNHFVSNCQELVRLGQALCVTCTAINDDKIEASLQMAPPIEAEALYMLSLEEEQLRLMDLGKTLELEVSEGEEEEDDGSIEEEEDDGSIEEEEGDGSIEEEEDDGSIEEEEDDGSMEEEGSEGEDDNSLKKEKSEDEASVEEEKPEDENSMEEEKPHENSTEEEAFDWHSCTLGAVYQGHIKTVREYGVIVEIENGSLGFAQSPLHTEGISLKEGAAVTVRVLDVNISLQLYDVTLSKRFISAPQETPSKSDAPGDRRGEKQKGLVVVQKADYVVVMLNDASKALALCSTTSFNHVKEPFSGIVLGQEIDCRILCDKGIGPSICDLRNAFKHSLSQKNVDLITSFFADTFVVGFISGKENRVTRPKASSANVMDTSLIGQTIQVSVKEITPSQLVVSLPTSMDIPWSQGYIWANDADGEKGVWPSGVSVGSSLLAKVVKVISVPTANKRTTKSKLLLSLRKDDLALPAGQVAERKSPESIVGKEVSGVVHRVAPDHLMVYVDTGLMGYVCPADIDGIASLAEISKKYHEGDKVTGTVLNQWTDPSMVNFSLLKSHDAYRVRCLIVDEFDDCVMLRVSGNRPGIMYCTDVCDPSSWTSYPLRNLSKGMIIDATILGETHAKPGHQPNIIVTMRDDIDAIHHYQLNEGDLVHGFVVRIEQDNVVIRLNYNMIRYIPNRFVYGNADSSPELKVGEMVVGRVIVSMKGKRTLSLLANDVKKGQYYTWKNIEEGVVVTGHVKRLLSRGVLLSIDNSNLVAFANQEECSDTPISDLSKVFAVDDAVKFRILKVDEANKRIDASMKSSMIPDEEEEIVVEEDSEGSANEMEEADDAETENEESVDQVDQEESDAAEPHISTSGFGWDDFVVEAPEDESPETPVSTSKPKRLSESVIASMERSLAAQDTLPESEADFERLLVAQPTSSHLWIRFASWYLSLAEVSKARAVLRRALKMIPGHLEEERSNLWLALLNLESEYGGDDALEATYKEARQAMDSRTVSLHLASIYESKKRFAEAYNVWKQLVKENKEDVEAWLGWCELYFKQGQIEESGEVLKRAQAVLKKNEKVRMLSSYAILLYKYNQPDQGKTIFEDLVSRLQKRLDLWNLYVDQEVKAEHYEFVRSLFKRMVDLKISVNKVKGVFKKWLAFEDAHGDEKHVTEVEEMVQEYINRLTAE